MRHGSLAAQPVGGWQGPIVAMLVVAAGLLTPPVLAAHTVGQGGGRAVFAPGTGRALAQATSVDELLLQAAEAARREDWRRARDLLERARQFGPPRTDVLFNLGLALERMNEPVEAATAYREALEANPDSVPAAENLASLLADHGDLDGGIHVLTAALDRQPLAGSLHYHLALLIFRREQRPNEVAIQNLERAQELGYTQPHLYLLLGRVARVLGESDRAAAFLRNGLSQAPEDPELLRELGLALAAREELTEAVDVLARAAALAPNNAGFAVDLAGVLLRAGRPSEALRILAPFDERDDPDVLYLVGRAQGDLGLPAARETLRWFQELKRRQKDETEASARAMAEVSQGILSWAAGDLEAAARDFERALAERPGWPTALSYLAAARLESGEVRAAINLAEEVLEVDPDNAQALVVLGRARMRTAPAEGLVLLERAVQRYPFRVVCLLSLAEAYAETGRHADAEALLARAARVEPENPWIVEIRSSRPW